jgi:NarL family two-component system response regulator LiaR
MAGLTPLVMTRVLIVDDHPLMRSGVRKALRKAPDMEVVGEAESGERALGMLRRVEPDIVLLDIQLPDTDGISLVSTIRAMCPKTRVIMLTCLSDERSVRMAVEAGASGYLTKAADPEQIVDAVRRVMDGQVSLSPEAATRLVAALRTGPSAAESALSAREIEVWRAMAEGLNNAEIAQQLFIAERTVKFHVHNILRKLGLRDRSEAICAAHRRGLLV